MAASAAAILFTLGINRLAQAAVIAPRALANGIPFAPEKDGKTFLANVFGFGALDRPTNLTSTLQLHSHAPRGGNRTLGDEWRSGVRLMADRFAARTQQR
jgi:hypothetical protein